MIALWVLWIWRTFSNRNSSINWLYRVCLKIWRDL